MARHGAKPLTVSFATFLEPYIAQPVPSDHPRVDHREIGQIPESVDENTRVGHERASREYRRVPWYTAFMHLTPLAMTSVFKQSPRARRAPTTMDLLDKALEHDELRAWALRLGLSEGALRTSRSRGRLSPVIAGALAEDLQLDPAQWIVIAAL